MSLQKGGSGPSNMDWRQERQCGAQLGRPIHLKSILELDIPPDDRRR